MIKNRMFLSPDGHMFNAYHARPAGKPKAGLVVVQENFGVNAHIREVCDGFAENGYEAIAPALYDRVEKNVELGYEQYDRDYGRKIRHKLGWDNPVKDMHTVTEVLREETSKVGVVGYCWGGTMAWLAASRLAVDCAVGYYGSQMFQFLGEAPQCPTLLHFGAEDPSVEMENVNKINEFYPDVAVRVYPGADHGFNCDHRSTFDETSAVTARKKTLGFFEEHLG
ncbi:MAG: dienelactone hydrolase family protein [Rhodospirillales bacterium]